MVASASLFSTAHVRIFSLFVRRVRASDEQRTQLNGPDLAREHRQEYLKI
jgi:hypothetical protein